MVRTVSVVRMGLVSAVVFLVAALANGKDIVQQNFTSPGTEGWLSSHSEMTVGAAGDGKIVLNNPVSANIGIMYYTPSEKPSVFTLTFNIKSATSSATTPQMDPGVMFCKQTNSLSGYYVSYDSNGNVIFWKVIQTQNGNDISYGWSPLEYKQTQYLESSDNTFTVSKSGNNFNVFVNGEYLYSVNDASYGSGDIGFFMPNGTSATFGAISMTDQFTEGGVRTSFSDGFGSGTLSNKWQLWPSSATSAFEVKNNELFASSTAGTGFQQMFVDLKVNNSLEVSVVTQHRGSYKGATDDDFYGIVLFSDLVPIEDNKLTRYSVKFGITATKYYTAFTTTDASVQINSQQSSAIRGSPGATDAEYLDTLTIVKKSGATTFDLLVNGEVISTHPVPNFEIVGVGIFTLPSSKDNATGLEVAFDNFYAGPVDGNTSIAFGRDPSKTIRARNASASRDQNVFYDLRGRKRYAVNPATAASNAPRRSAGVYVNKNGREVAVRKSRR